MTQQQSTFSEIPVLGLQKQYEPIANEIEEAVLSVLRSGHYILGKHGTELEKDVAAMCGCDYGVAVANGTDALILALWALDIGPGDEVITSPFTFAATVEAIALRGAKAVFVDINPQTYNIDIEQIAKVITPKTKAILPVHLYGQPADMDQICQLAKQFGLKVIEDNAQGIGALYKGRPTGSFSNLACISFYPTKNLGAAGDAGMIVTNDEALAKRLKKIRAHGMDRRYYHDELGVNSRLDEIQAAILRCKLPHLAKWNERRREIADLYNQILANVPGLTTPKLLDHTTHVYHQYTVQIEDRQPQPGATRDAVQAELAKRKIGSMCYYPIPLHLQVPFAHFNYKKGDFPHTEKAASQVLSLPMYPELTDDQVRYVATTLKEIIMSTSTVPTMQNAPVVGRF